MTCIAWDGKTLVADSRVCNGSTIVTDSYNKIIKTSDVKKV